MDHHIFSVPVLSFIFRTARAIPIAPAQEDPAAAGARLRRDRAGARSGRARRHLPGRALTDDGEIDEFRGGVERILERTPVPVVPMALPGLWDSLFARNRDKLRHAGKLFPRIRLAVGEPVSPLAVTPQGLQAAVLAMRGDWK